MVDQLSALVDPATENLGPPAARKPLPASRTTSHSTMGRLPASATSLRLEIHLAHFGHYAPEKIDYAIDRYWKENNRLFGLLDKQLGDRPYICEQDYSVADMACYPWIVPHEKFGQDMDTFPRLKRWFESVRQRPATIRTWQLAERINPGLIGVQSEEERRVMFGQSAANINAAGKSTSGA